MQSLVGIGEFARLSHLSVRALRHYHDRGILLPASVDPSTGYRRYELSQVPDAHLVRRLRDLDMPLDDVRSVLTAPDAAARDEVLTAHLRRTEDALERTRRSISSLRQLLDHSAVEPPEINIVTVDDLLAITVSDSVSIDDVETWSVETFARLGAAAERFGTVVTGPAGSLFSSDFYADGNGEVVAFLPVSGFASDLATDDGDFDLDVIAGGTYAAAVHAGAHADLDRTYGHVGGHVNRHYRSGPGPVRERYLVAPPDELDEFRWRTELLWPLA